MRTQAVFFDRGSPNFIESAQRRILKKAVLARGAVIIWNALWSVCINELILQRVLSRIDRAQPKDVVHGKAAKCTAFKV